MKWRTGAVRLICDVLMFLPLLAALVTQPPHDLDVPAVHDHVTAIARLIGKPAHILVDALGKAATVGDGMIEWNLTDLGIAAGATYGYATVDHGKITGVFFRGRAELDTLRLLKFPRGIQLTEAGGERPAFSIVAGE